MKIRALLLTLLSPLPAFAQTPAPAAAPAPAPAGTPLRLSFSSTSAIGVTHAGFFNQLLGVRLDYRFTPRFAFGGSLAYANLEGKSKRVHNALPEVMLEYRVPLSGEKLGVPLRFAGGFLPQNGPTARLGAGLGFALTDAVSLDIVPIEPMVWVNRDRPEVSLNAGVSLRVAL
jgi:hypothetical protein